MKKKTNIINLLSVSASAGSAIVLVIISARTYDFATSLKDLSGIVPILITLTALFIGLSSFYISTRLKNRYRNIFMIYSHQDKETANQIKDEFARYTGIKILTDEQVVNIGDNIKDELKKQIKYSDSIIILISKNTKESNWIENEIKIAKENNKKIYPIMIDKSDLPSDLSGIKYADLREISKETIYPLFKAIKEQ